jgi:NTE family protein
VSSLEPDARLRAAGISGRGAADGAIGLALSGGGARGAYQAGVLRGIARQAPGLRLPILTGVSAGAINAAFLAGRPEPLPEAIDRLVDLWTSLETGSVLRTDIASLAGNAIRVLLGLGSGGGRLAPQVRGLVDTSPLRGLLGDVIRPEGIEANLHAGRLRALAVSATSYRTGQTVTFVQSVPGVATWDRVRHRSVAGPVTSEHVMASAAIPLFFPAGQVQGEWFGDGGIRLGHPLAPARLLGADRILAISSRYRGRAGLSREPEYEGYPPAAQIVGLMLNSIFLDNLDVDAERLQRINRLVSRVPPERRWLLSERPVHLLVLRPSEDIGRIAARHEARLPRALRYLARGLGTRRVPSPDLLSYLLFESEYLGELVQLGERDAERSWLRIRRFLAAGPDPGPATDDV